MPGHGESSAVCTRCVQNYLPPTEDSRKMFEAIGFVKADSSCCPADCNE